MSSLIARQNTRVVLAGHEIPASDPSLQVIGVFNPGVVRVEDEVVLLVRVAEAPTQQGHARSPRITGFTDNKPVYAVDTLAVDTTFLDPRKFRLTNGYYRLSSISRLVVVRLDAATQRVKEVYQPPELFGQGVTEDYGIEDPRITKINDTFYITYVAVSSVAGITTGLLQTKDFRSFTRHGTLFPSENKDVVLFPEKINNAFFAYHRPTGNLSFSPMAILSAESPDLIHWGHHTPVLLGTKGDEWQASRIGAGTPPMKTKEGWLTLFHTIIKEKSAAYSAYVIHAMLTDLSNPAKVLKHTHEPLLVPETDFETKGFVPNVIFPTGLIEEPGDSDALDLYYGAADTVVAVTTLSKREILAALV